ncbi:unnamed protein product [Cuscuta campestris]|uniref:Uncharacterized protein n=1 Tax=Cuscuta campestris TaxID=132261 RepID=A0A484LMP9_9ASTE|nr:unnamed protein product [Cuscuta campestris]
MPSHQQPTTFSKNAKQREMDKNVLNNHCPTTSQAPRRFKQASKKDGPSQHWEDFMPIIEDINNEEQPHVLDRPHTSFTTAPHAKSPNPYQELNSFPDLTYLEVNDRHKCMEIIPYVPCSEDVNKHETFIPTEEVYYRPGSKDDGFLNSTMVPQWEPYSDQTHQEKETTLLVCHSDGGGEGDTPFLNQKLEPLAIDTSRLKFLKRKYAVDFMCVLEPMVNASQRDHFRLQLGFSNCLHSFNNKRWIFWNKASLHLNTCLPGRRTRYMVRQPHPTVGVENFPQAQVEYENFPNEINRESAQLANAKLIKAVNEEVEYWKQKANIGWLDKGDANSKLFQEGKRKKLSITHILSTEGKGLSSPGR